MLSGEMISLSFGEEVLLQKVIPQIDLREQIRVVALREAPLDSSSVTFGTMSPQRHLPLVYLCSRALGLLALVRGFMVDMFHVRRTTSTKPCFPHHPPIYAPQGHLSCLDLTTEAITQTGYCIPNISVWWRRNRVYSQHVQ